MKAYNFNKLTPSEKVDLNIYLEAFSYVFENNDICNVAISGPYSAGKSSLLKSYEKTSITKFLYLSLAHFEHKDKTDDFKGSEKSQEKYSLMNNNICTHWNNNIPVGIFVKML